MRGGKRLHDRILFRAFHPAVDQGDLVAETAPQGFGAHLGGGKIALLALFAAAGISRR